LYRRLQARRGTKNALVAVGHAILVIIDHILSRQEAYQDLGANDFDEQDRQAVQRRLVRRLEQLGYQGTLQPAPLRNRYVQSSVLVGLSLLLVSLE